MFQHPGFPSATFKWSILPFKDKGLRNIAFTCFQLILAKKKKKKIQYPPRVKVVFKMGIQRGSFNPRHDWFLMVLFLLFCLFVCFVFCSVLFWFVLFCFGFGFFFCCLFCFLFSFDTFLFCFACFCFCFWSQTFFCFVWFLFVCLFVVVVVFFFLLFIKTFDTDTMKIGCS